MPAIGTTAWFSTITPAGTPALVLAIPNGDGDASCKRLREELSEVLKNTAEPADCAGDTPRICAPKRYRAAAGALDAHELGVGY